jgi:hypothetical protein
MGLRQPCVDRDVGQKANKADTKTGIGLMAAYRMSMNAERRNADEVLTVTNEEIVPAPMKA